MVKPLVNSLAQVYKNIVRCNSCGLIFTNVCLDSEAYSEIHSEAIGSLWLEHHTTFSEFIKSQIKKNSKILEIGPSNNPLFRGNTVFIDMFEKSPFILQKNESYLKGQFPNLNMNQKFDVIVASHVFEHATNPHKFLEKCLKLLTDEGQIFFSIPNFLYWINQKYWNGITAEHQIYPTEYQIIKICSQINLFPSFEYFYNHSIFIKISKKNELTKKVEKEIDIIQWGNSIKSSVLEVEQILNDKKIDEIFVTGASHLSQYPILMSKEIERKVRFVLDNSKRKHEKRVYGTEKICKPFDVLKDLENPYVVLFNSPYRNEMIEQINSINDSAHIISV